MTAEAMLALVDGCRDSHAAVPQTGPLPGAYRKRALAALASGERSIRRALERLEVVTVELDSALLLNVNAPADLLELARQR
jgi:molybdopterin-guanine dinucleotide biosynthesis protein A